MNALIAALTTWIAAATGLPVPDRPPTVDFASPCQIERLVTGDALRPCPKTVRYVAAYDHRIARITLPKGWNAGDLYDVSTLLHELVHHMQASAGQVIDPRKPCSGPALEKPAYDAQIAFLEAAGVDALAVMGINALMLMVVTQCMEPPYYNREQR